MVPVIRLFSNLREVMFGMVLSSGGMVPTNCSQDTQSHITQHTVRHHTAQRKGGEKGKTTPLGLTYMRSQVLYQAAQAHT